jgi:hypothetical protein
MPTGVIFFHFIANRTNNLFLTQQFQKSQMATMVEDELPIFFSARVHGILLFTAAKQISSHILYLWPI